MPTINYYFADLYPDQLGEPDVSVVISDEEWNRRIEQEHRWESDGRIARREISVFDAQMAQLLDDHMAEKSRVRNRRKADRKHKLTPKMRKEQEYMRNWNVCMKMVNYGKWDDIPIVEGRVRSKEKSDRADWELDLRDLEYDISYAEFDVATCREELCEMNMDIQSLEYQLSDVELLRDRLERLWKYRDEIEEYLRNSEEFLRKYMWAKEMIV